MKIVVTSGQESKENTALQYIWAREKIARLSDYSQVGDNVEDEVTLLGLTYHLMTQYTSFVAVDSIKRNTGEIVTVKQPLPLPEGVSNLAVGGVACKSINYRAMPAMEEKCQDAFYGDRKTDKIKKARTTVSRLYITAGKTPQGTTLYEIEQIVIQKIKQELEKTFSEWQLTHLVISLKVVQGNVTSAVVIKYTANKCQADVLNKLFGKLTFDPAITGTIELTLDVM